MFRFRMNLPVTMIRTNSSSVHSQACWRDRSYNKLRVIGSTWKHMHIIPFPLRIYDWTLDNLYFQTIHFYQHTQWYKDCAFASMNSLFLDAPKFDDNNRCREREMRCKRLQRSDGDSLSTASHAYVCIGDWQPLLTSPSIWISVYQPII